MFPAMEPTDTELISAVLKGDVNSFETLVRRYQPRIFATVRRHSRRESEVEDIVQEVFIKAFQRLETFRGDAPFEHWLMRLTVRTCIDFLRAHQRNRELSFTELSPEEGDWLERVKAGPDDVRDDADAARRLIQRVLEQMPPEARMVITLQEIEEKSMKEIAELTGWSIALVKVRAFRARAQMRKILKKITTEKYL